jgi:hypothetical protein
MKDGHAHTSLSVYTENTHFPKIAKFFSLLLLKIERTILLRQKIRIQIAYILIENRQEGKNTSIISQ